MFIVGSCSIGSLTWEKLTGTAKELGLPAFRAGQIFSWLHSKQVTGFEQMTNLPAALRQELSDKFFIDAPKAVRVQTSKDGTQKYLFSLCDGNCVETVLMQYSYGNSLCISSQVGCRMGCRFCASTQGGLVRNLSAGEMLAQVYAAMRYSGHKVNRIVLMGIGEPLDNFDAVMDFISIITDERGMNLSIRNITLSTSGLVPAIQKLAQRNLGLTLSVSLHGADNKTRSSMMPVNDAWPLEKLIPACRKYQQATGRRVSFEYAMVKGVNDSEADAKNLAAMLKGMGSHINLIPVNPVDGSAYGPSDDKRVKEFCGRLNSLGLNATIRRRLGTDIDAACGQLRRNAAGNREDI